MNVKSPCIDKCKLNLKTDLCEGCYRSAEEISNWKVFTNEQKKNVLKLLKKRKLKFLFFFLMLLINSNVFTNEIWLGKWKALDQWQSEFIIEIKKDGLATTDYGNGENGSWSIVDGNLEIIWKSGKIDFLFRGVMGYQRLSKNKGGSYTSGLSRSLD